MKYLVLLLAFAGSLNLSGQNLNIGLKFQKTHTLYWENGISIQYSFPSIKPGQLYFGLDYVSSRFGSAINSNALIQDRYVASAAWFWRKDQAFQIFTKLNVGYFNVQLEEEIFKELPNTATFVAPEFGLSYNIKNIPLSVNLGSGLNFEKAAAGTSPGTLLPLYYYLTFYYHIN